MPRKNDDAPDLSMIISDATSRAVVKPTVPASPQNTWVNDALDTNTTIELAKALEGAFAAEVFADMTTHNAGATMRGADAILALRDTATTPEQLANNTQIAKAFTEEMARGVGQINTEAKAHILNTVKTPYQKPAPPPPPRAKKSLLERIFDTE